MANPEHVAKLKEGVAAWNDWRKENRQIRPDLSGADLHGFDLRRFDLREANLSVANFFEAVLSGANPIRANLSGADLSEACLVGADLFSADVSRANLFEANLSRASLIRADLTRANLAGADLFSADLHGANLTDANVTDLSYLESGPGQRSRIQFRLPAGASFLQHLRTNPIPYRKRVMRGRYKGIRGLSSCYGNRLFARDASDQDYLDTLEDQWLTLRGRFLFWLWGLIDYVRNLLSVFVSASILICIFGAVYSHWPGMLSYGDRCPTGFTPFYFSIVTYTTLGFGDVKPNNLPGEILVSAEVIMGYVTLGLLLAVLADKIAR